MGTIILINCSSVLHTLIFSIYSQIYKVITQRAKVIQAPPSQQGLVDIFFLFCDIRTVSVCSVQHHKKFKQQPNELQI